MGAAEFLPLVRQVASAEGVPFELLAAVAQVESSWNPKAYRYEAKLGEASYGLCQTLYSTARSLGFTGKPEELFDPITSLTFGARYIAQQLGRFGSPAMAAAAYNAGPGRVGREVARAGAADIERIDAALPAITRNYWRKVAVWSAYFGGKIGAAEAQLRAKTLELSSAVLEYAKGHSGLMGGVAVVLIFLAVGLLVRR